MNKEGYGHVYLVGAGPGDAGLITVKGKQALENADVVVYDHLISMSLLNDVRDDAELICAGKRSSRHLLKQEQTNALLIEYAKKGYNVVRLKGGDPFIFGRGGEEALELKNAGIEFTIIPGVSSCYSVPAYNGIPVTHRTMASSLHVITGHESKEKRGNSVFDYAVLAKEEGTLVFLMGLSNLPNIVAELIAHGKDPETPAAVLQEGTTGRQKAAYAPLKDIEAECSIRGIGTPAIIVIGDVTTLGPELSWFEKGPLFGKKIMVTGTKLLAGHLVGRIAAAGGEPVAFSLINIRPLPVDFSDISRYTWAVFTSGNGVSHFFDGLREQGIDLRSIMNMKFAVIGSGTARALKKQGFTPDYMPDSFISDELANGLVPLLRPEDKVGMFRAKKASKSLNEIFDENHVDYDDVALYETVNELRKAEELNRQISQMDYIIFGSSSAVKAFAEMTRGYDGTMPNLVSIGPVTTKTMKSCGLPVALQAKVHTVDGVCEEIIADAKENVRK